MSSNTIRLTITDEFKNILETIKLDFPLLSYPELIKMAVSGFFTQSKRQRITQWEQNLPVLTLSDKAQSELTQALKDNKTTKSLSIDEIMVQSDSVQS